MMVDKKNVDPEWETFPQSSGIIPKEFVNEYRRNDSLGFSPVDDGKWSHILR